jgi:hypothetical protein
MTGLSKKRLLLNLTLLIIVAGLISFIVTREADEGESYATLYDKSIGDDAKEIIIHVEGKDDVLIELEDEIWSVVKPSKFVADKDKIRHLFTLLSENAERNYPSEGKDLASYGLDKDRLSISFNGVKMLFGKLNEITEKRFILKADRIYLISETISGLMMMGEEGFRPQEKPKLIPVPKKS